MSKVERILKNGVRVRFLHNSPSLQQADHHFVFSHGEYHTNTRRPFPAFDEASKGKGDPVGKIAGNSGKDYAVAPRPKFSNGRHNAKPILRRRTVPHCSKRSRSVFLSFPRRKPKTPCSVGRSGTNAGSRRATEQVNGPEMREPHQVKFNAITNDDNGSDVTDKRQGPFGHSGLGGRIPPRQCFANSFDFGFT